MWFRPFFAKLYDGLMWPSRTVARRRYVKEGAKHADVPVAIIMTAYNSAAFIEKAVRSVFAQTHKNIHLYVIDDASTDNTVEVLKELAATDPRMSIYRSSENHGTYWSKNWLLDKVQEPYVAFHDSDDWSHPDRIQLQLGAMKKTGAIAVNVQWERVDGQGIQLSVNGYWHRMAAVSLMFDRGAVLQKVGFFDNVRIAADTEFLGRIVAIAGAHAHLSLPHVAYTGWVRPNSLTTSTSSGVVWVRQSGHLFNNVIGDRARYLEAAGRWHASCEVKAVRRGDRCPFGLNILGGVSEVSECIVQEVKWVI